MIKQIEVLILAPAALAGLVAYWVTPFVIKFAKKFALVDDPKRDTLGNKIHKKPIPRAGGIAIFIAVLVASLILLPIDKHLIGILLGASILVVMGVADDKWNLNPYMRLVIQFLGAAAPIAAGIGIAYISNPLGGVIDLSHPRITFFALGEVRSIWLAADLLALFWIVSLMNFLNMGAKGVDGQLTGVAAVAAIVIALLSLKFSADIAEWQVAILASIVGGAYLGFLPWHIYPQKIMPSFSGSNLAGYFLGVLSILTTTKLGTLALVLAVPIIDTSYTIIRRVASGKSPVWGDRGHLHHKLLDMGFSRRQVAYVYWISSVIFGFIALQLDTASKLYMLFVAALILLGIIILSKKLINNELN